jgi:hypothetical protein
MAQHGLRPIVSSAVAAGAASQGPVDAPEIDQLGEPAPTVRGLLSLSSSSGDDAEAGPKAPARVHEHRPGRLEHRDQRSVSAGSTRSCSPGIASRPVLRQQRVSRESPDSTR